MNIAFSKFHTSYVVGVVDIVSSTELISKLSADETDTFFTLFLTHFTGCINHTGARIVKNMGDGFLFYMKESEQISEDDIRSLLACADAIISSVPSLNEKLDDKGLPNVAIRLSMSYGPASVMINANGEIMDIFGSTVNTCAKMNKMAKANTVVMGSELAEYARTQRDMEEIGLFKINKKLSFPVFLLS